MIAFALALLLAPPPATQTATTPPAQAADAVTLQADFLKDWEAQKNKLMKIAAAMPDDKFGFKPKPELRTGRSRAAVLRARPVDASAARLSDDDP
jgi:hypothetical protein